MNFYKELVKSINGNIIIEGVTEGTPITVFSISGTLLYKDVVRGDKTFVNSCLKHGMIAIVKIGNRTMKVIVD